MPLPIQDVWSAARTAAETMAADAPDGGAVVRRLLQTTPVPSGDKIPIYENIIFQVFVGVGALICLCFLFIFCVKGMARKQRRAWHGGQDLSYTNADIAYLNGGYSTNPAAARGKRTDSIFEPYDARGKLLAVHTQGLERFELRQSPHSGYGPEWHDCNPKGMVNGMQLKGTAPAQVWDIHGNRQDIY